MDGARVSDSGDNNVPLPSNCNAGLNELDCVLRNAGWLCGFRMDNMDGPQVLGNQVASYVDGATPFIEEKNDILTEIVTTRHKQESNYVHQGWSVGAATTTSPWTQSRIDATNRYNAGGTWTTRRTLAIRLRAQVLLEDLTPAPEFVVAIEEALTRSSIFEKFQGVYRTLNRWGDVVPLEIEMGSSLTFTDTETNFVQLPATSFDNFSDVSKIKTANIVRKGSANNMEWSDGSWAMTEVPATRWRLIRVLMASPTINLLSNDLQARLTDLYSEKFSYVPSLTIGSIGFQHKIEDDANNASRTISSVEIHSTNEIIGLSIKYLDGVVSRGGRDVGNRHIFALNKGEYIIEMLTCAGNEWLHGTPTISKSKGGVLVGFSTRSKKHPEWDYLITGVKGIWRYDLMPSIPKENDIYSDYFGATNQCQRDFSDRELIGNSSSMHITSVEVWAGAGIDGIQFTYTNPRGEKDSKLKATRHGGFGGARYRFELGKGEYIVSVSGRSNEKGITQLCFGTNKGRTSEVYGGAEGQPFFALSPVSESGNAMRLQYIIGKSDGTKLNGIMFVWTPEVP
ncbi:hypothetical protein RSOLAG22IIIB_05197 [Rhizoctonia solani]|uniref:Jacalin-type lectin domain-containing protein n=1 Tax=Rhizoctonia solani TaxID=456999 RepID=A0A0K6G482_9AGAM|nr:hypothetical protein RSOLAG22IIIB_05197 [Rhizoctonia solani]